MQRIVSCVSRRPPVELFVLGMACAAISLVLMDEALTRRTIVGLLLWIVTVVLICVSGIAIIAAVWRVLLPRL
jgi:multisubunit Na+/H+ antiporter MnhE subunit